MREFEWAFEIEFKKIKQSLYTIVMIWSISNLWNFKNVFHKYDT